MMDHITDQITMVTTMQPETHYSRSLCRALEAKTAVRILAEIDECNSQLPFRDVEQVFVPGEPLVRPLLAAIGRARNQVVHFQHEFNMFGGAAGIVRFLVLLYLVRRRGIRIVVTSHAVVIPTRIDQEFVMAFSMPPFRSIPGVIRLVFRVFYYSMGKLADRITVHTDVMAQQLAQYYHVDPRKICTLPIGVDDPPARIEEPTERWASPLRGRPYALFFGYLLRRKGLDVLLDAFDQLKLREPKALLVISGGELPNQRDYARAIRERAAASVHAADIIFTSFVSEDQIDWLFANASIVVLPYTVTVASGSLPLCFAMRFGRPVVASKTPPFEELNEKYPFIEMAITGNVSSLANAMADVMGDPERMERMTQEAKRAASALSWSSVADRLCAIYQSLGAVGNSSVAD